MVSASANTLLVVDDDAFHRELITAQLANLGWSDVLCAASGEEALEVFANFANRIAIIITDLSMPGMDGAVLMRHLAQRGFSGSVVVLSSVSEEILSSAAGLAQAHGLHLLGVLPKPSSTEHLRDLLGLTHDPEPTLRRDRIEHSLSLERLRAALQEGELVPWYQPKVHVHTGKVVGVEALARWPLERGNAIGPGQFVPAMENAGLVDTLFFSIAEQVVADLVRWRSAGLHFKAAINMSMKTAHNLEVPERLLALLTQAGLQPSDLVVEVTESQLMIERSMALETLTRLSMMGFTLSIDDFGTGYSSLVQLIDLPFREFKIDGSFVRRASQERKAQAVVRISIMIGLNLNMEVIAEGVETEAQLEYVRACGGTVVQGYKIAKPMPFDACDQWIRTR